MYERTTEMKKTLSIIMALAMVLSVCFFSVSAAEATVGSVAAEEEIKPVSVSEPKSESKAGVLPLTASLQAKTIKDITLADTTDYSISGTMLTHKLKSGETIIQLSNRYYGDKRLWPYIVKHNQDVIKNPDDIPVGTEVKIPELVLRN